MFTGIVQGKAQIVEINAHSADKFLSLNVVFPEDKLKDISTGASIAINGTCLTVVDFKLDQHLAQFDVIKETLSKTNLGELSVGDWVNFERAARFGDEIGGHVMSGHIFCTTEILNIERTPANTRIRFSLPADIKDYILEKGFVGLNGCSLTLAQVSDSDFQVHLIPETLTVTTFGEVKPGDRINLEVDAQTQAIVDTVKRIQGQSI